MARHAAAGGESSPFGRELRGLRERRHLSLQQLAELVSYSRGYLGKVETGDKPATSELAHRCDEALEAGGTLIALAVREGLPRLAQLPAAAATFVGRTAELRQLEAVLVGEGLPGAPRTVAIDGPPGAGKTALALRLAHQVKDRFPDGQLYVDLHGHSPNDSPAHPATVLEEFLIALGQPIDTIPAGHEQRAALYRSLLDGRRVLLVLDNAWDSRQVMPLLPGSARCGIVVTSRTRLAGLEVSNEQRLTLGPLTERESVTLLGKVIGAARVDEEPGAVLGLAGQCGHLPLALRIAAERVATHPHHSVTELVTELADEGERLGLSTDGSFAIRTAFSWSYRDLDGESARMFRLLGLHRGPHLSTQAAAALAGVPTAQARRSLDRLVGVHLVEGIGGGRFRVHDLLRVYAAERAAAEEPDDERRDAVRRVLDWYLYSTYEANHVLAPQRHDPVLAPSEFELPVMTFVSYDQALSWCEIEMPNLVGATELALESGRDAVAWQLPVGCWNYLFLRKRWGPWISAHEAGLIGAQRSGDRFGESWTMNNLAQAHRELRHFDDARGLFDSALLIRREIGDRIGEAWTLAALGLLAMDLGDYEGASDRFCEALRIRGEIARDHAADAAIFVANQHGEGIALANLGDIYRQLSRFDESLTCLRQALDIFREISDRHGEGYTLVKLGDTYRKQRRTEDAVRAYQEALTTRRAIGDRWGEAETLHNSGLVLLDSGQRETALEFWRQAIEIFRELGDPRAEDLRTQLASATARSPQDEKPETE
ncbi:MAG TPA: tetratricopeptide repeat protein [Pseudonocardiaceae bacterium]|nr:tetratricopeptide repeat protein [Pseudonocardiaceae bacterium]